MEGFRTDLPLNQLDDKHIDLILYGSEDERRIKLLTEHEEVGDFNGTLSLRE